MKCNALNSGAATTPAPQPPVCDGQVTPLKRARDSSKTSIDKQVDSDSPPKEKFQRMAMPAWLAKSVSTGGTAELGLQKTTEPPVRELSGKALLDAIRAFQKDLNDNWQKVEVPLHLADEDTDQNDCAQPKRSHQERWNERYESASLILQKFLIQAQSGELDESSFFGYFVSDKPVGLMLITNDKIKPTISFLVTHPGSAGCGGILVAYAAKQFREWGAEGKIRIYPLNEDAEEAYLALGFERRNDVSGNDGTGNDDFDFDFHPALGFENGNDGTGNDASVNSDFDFDFDFDSDLDFSLILDVKKSEKWDENTLDLKKYVGKKYIA